MAAHQFRPDNLPPVPLAFVPSAFTQEAGQTVPPPFAAAGASYGAYPPPAFGSGGYAQPSSFGGGRVGSSFGAPSFDDEPPLLEGAQLACVAASAAHA